MSSGNFEILEHLRRSKACAFENFNVYAFDMLLPNLGYIPLPGQNLWVVFWRWVEMSYTFSILCQQNANGRYIETKNHMRRSEISRKETFLITVFAHLRVHSKIA